jgi:hypothetical protein
MSYSADQIGPLEIRDYGGRTKERLALVLIQHDREPGHDESQITVISPCSYAEGRTRTLAMIAAGIDIDDIRFVRVPLSYEGPGEQAGDGQQLENVWRALWWTTEDDSRRLTAGPDGTELPMANYARQRLRGRKVQSRDAR